MSTGDRKHFEDYREQTRVKHDILAAYLPAYFHILKGFSKNLVFIDGFAGRGTYTEAATGEEFPGSPLLALKLVADNESFAQQVSTVFIESDELLFKELTENVEAFHNANPNIRKPIVELGIFSDIVSKILGGLDGKLAPTFLFVDPCGVKGASFDTIRAVMENRRCETFIFFNIDGVRRIAGLSDVSDVLVELMGTKERAVALHRDLRRTTSVVQREEIIMSHYSKALIEDIGCRYLIRFRVEHEVQRKASHYFIHATKHSLGFTIMKDVMWRRGRGRDQAGGIELRQKSRTNFIPMFDLRGDEIKDRILATLKTGPRLVSLFSEEWPGRPDDLQCSAEYRQVLLQLEADGQIEVLSKDGKNVMGAGARRKFRGKPTLGKDHFVRLPKP